MADIPLAPPRPDGAIVRVEACGICRSDWHFWNQDLGWIGVNLSLPAVLGHEVGGVVEEVGPDVKTVGCGGIGLSAVQIGAAADALVVAVDIDDRKLTKAREEGAAVTINARGLKPEEVAQAVKDATGGGAHVSIEAPWARLYLPAIDPVAAQAWAARAGGSHIAGGAGSSFYSHRYAAALRVVRVSNLEPTRASSERIA